jgi:hypothetical protein
MASTGRGRSAAAVQRWRLNPPQAQRGTPTLGQPGAERTEPNASVIGVVRRLAPYKAGMKPLSPGGRGVGERGTNLAASVLSVSPGPLPPGERGAQHTADAQRQSGIRFLHPTRKQALQRRLSLARGGRRRRAGSRPDQRSEHAAQQARAG